VQAVVGAAKASFGAARDGVLGLGRKLGLVRDEDDEGGAIQRVNSTGTSDSGRMTSVESIVRTIGPNQILKIAVDGALFSSTDDINVSISVEAGVGKVIGEIGVIDQNGELIGEPVRFGRRNSAAGIHAPLFVRPQRAVTKSLLAPPPGILRSRITGAIENSGSSPITVRLSPAVRL